jgi:hypothetical protein
MELTQPDLSCTPNSLRLVAQACHPSRVDDTNREIDKCTQPINVLFLAAAGAAGATVAAAACSLLIRPGRNKVKSKRLANQMDQ